VLCEADRANAREAETLIAVQKDRQITAEAFMIRSHPQWHQAKSWVDGGRIGIWSASDRVLFNRDATNIRNRKDGRRRAFTTSGATR
jgi:predicted dehydrogenase